MADIIQKRRDTAANWTAANPILAQGEEAYELDTNKQKRGDGVTAWNALPYLAAGGGFPIITIASRPYELRKTVNLTDPAKTTTLETGDIVFGTPAAGVYVFAKRLAGGDANDINDTDAFEIFGGI